nr:M20/M25/M40 family metallo-hydrolase [Geomonas sp. RF6]
MPGRSHKGPLPPLTEEETELAKRLRQHVTVLAKDIGERNTTHYKELQHAAAYIEKELGAQGYAVRKEPYRIGEREMVNIEAELKGTSHAEEIVVVGAHYDSVAGAPGANDNASGVAAVLELARLLRDQKPARTVRLVAFVNEEPPWFLSEEMGSRVYTRGARKRGDKIAGMLSLETIGYYSDAHGSQQYPAPFSSFYPDTGNFIGMVSNLPSCNLLRRVIRTFRKTTPFPSEGLAAPDVVPGIGWSDHWSFWQEGYPAVMITDTAPFRYPYYHDAQDTPDKLDYERMARVTAGVHRVVQELSGE